MFRPDEPAVLRRTGTPVTIVQYLDRSHVLVRDPHKVHRTVFEGELRRPLADTDIERFSGLYKKSEARRAARYLHRTDSPKDTRLECETKRKKTPEEAEAYFLRQREIGRKLAKAVADGSIEIDWNGHNHNWNADELDEAVRERVEGSLASWRFFCPEDRFDAFEAALDGGPPLDEWLDVSGFLEFGCSVCGANPYSSQQETNGKVIRWRERCDLADWNGTTTILFDCPSGKLLVDDDLRPLTQLPVGAFDINGDKGKHLTTELYAKAGMAHGFVGNSCPGIYKDEARRVAQKGQGYVIANIPDTKQHEKVWGESLAGICTDLWWYSMIDLDEAKRRAEAMGYDLDGHMANWSVNVIDIEPGCYELTHYHEANWSSGKPTIYARFHRVGPARTDQPDYLKTMAYFQVTAEQAVAAQIKNWPTLYKKGDYARSAAAVANSMMVQGCVPDRDWHPNGFKNKWTPFCELPKDPPPIPPFHFQYRWYQAGDLNWSTLATAARGWSELHGRKVKLPLNLSFRRLAFNILESIISYGVPVDVDTHDDNTVYRLPQDAMQLAVQLYRKLAKQYPASAKMQNPAFYRWMKDTRKVRNWTRNWFTGCWIPDALTPGTRVITDSGRKGRIIKESRNTPKAKDGHSIVDFGKNRQGQYETLLIPNENLRVRQEPAKSALSPEELVVVYEILVEWEKTQTPQAKANAEAAAARAVEILAQKEMSA